MDRRKASLGSCTNDPTSDARTVEMVLASEGGPAGPRGMLDMSICWIRLDNNSAPPGRSSLTVSTPPAELMLVRAVSKLGGLRRSIVAVYY